MRVKKVVRVKTVKDEKKPRFVVVISGEINEELYNAVLSRMSDYISNKEAFSGITIIITSFGGFAHIGLAIYDFMKSLNAEIYTVAIGACASAATIIFALGQRRFVSENVNFLIHSARVEFSDIVTMKEVGYLANTIEFTNSRMQKILTDCISNEDFKKRLEDTLRTVKEDNVTVEDLLTYVVATDKFTDFDTIIFYDITPSPSSNIFKPIHIRTIPPMISALLLSISLLRSVMLKLPILWKAAAPALQSILSQEKARECL